MSLLYLFVSLWYFLNFFVVHLRDDLHQQWQKHLALIKHLLISFVICLWIQLYNIILDVFYFETTPARLPVLLAFFSFTDLLYCTVWAWMTMLPPQQEAMPLLGSLKSLTHQLCQLLPLLDQKCAHAHSSSTLEAPAPLQLNGFGNR